MTYRKKPILVEAWRYCKDAAPPPPKWTFDALLGGRMYHHDGILYIRSSHRAYRKVGFGSAKGGLSLPINEGDYVVQEPDGILVMNQEEFNNNYEVQPTMHDVSHND